MVNTKLHFYILFRSQNLIHTVPYWSSVSCSLFFLHISIDCVMHLNATGVTQHFYMYLPIMPITIQWPLFSVPKVTVTKRFNCTIFCCWLSAQMLGHTCWLNRGRSRLSGSHVHKQITKEGVSCWLGWSMGCHWSSDWSSDWSSHWLSSWSSFLSLSTWTRWMAIVKIMWITLKFTEAMLQGNHQFMEKLHSSL